MAQEAAEPAANDDTEVRRPDFEEVDPPHDSRRHAIIIVGLPGDRPHQEQFDALVGHWSRWLSRGLGVPPANLSVLSATPLNNVARPLAADATSVVARLQQLVADLQEDDSLWILFLGHANYDGQRALFHLPGPDLSAQEYGELLKPLRCREQVVWLTMGSSGWFLRPLSREGRVVIAATLTDAEIDALSQKLISAVKSRLGGTLRT